MHKINKEGQQNGICGACAGGCPVGAISEGDAHYQIDADTCIECGACAGTCPSGAISQE